MTETPTEYALSKIPQATKDGNQWRASCPGCESYTLVIQEDDDGGCRVYCDNKCDGDENLARLGLTYSDLAPKRKRQSVPSSHVPIDTAQEDTAPSDQADATPEFTPFPVELLPDPVRSYVSQAAAAIGCDPSYVATPALAVLAGCVGNTRRLRINSTWCEPCIVWSACVGKSGTLKTPALAVATEAIARRQGVLFREYATKLAEYQREKIVYDADLAEWKRKGRKNDEPPPQEPTEPRPVQFVSQDMTIEALAVLLAENPRGLLAVHDELSGWVGAFDAYSSGAGKDAAQWLSIHSGQGITVNRKTGIKMIHVPRAAVSIAGGIQPGALALALAGRDGKGSEHIDNGLAGRLLFAMPPDATPYYSDRQLSGSTKRAWERLLDRLITLQMEETDDGPMPMEVTLDADARREWIAQHNRHAQHHASLNATLAASSAKCKAYAARFALLIHLVRDETSSVDVESIKAGWGLSWWYFQEAVRVFSILGRRESAQERQLRELVALVQDHGGSMTTRELQHAKAKYRNSAELAESALDELRQRNLGEWESIGPTARGGRPTRRFCLFSADPSNTTPTFPRANGVSLLLPPIVSENLTTTTSDRWGEV